MGSMLPYIAYMDPMAYRMELTSALLLGKYQIAKQIAKDIVLDMAGSKVSLHVTWKINQLDQARDGPSKGHTSSDKNTQPL